jgi:hypothetical protein
MYAYISPPAMVHLSKPAHCREAAFTDKTGGCNSKADVMERMDAQAPAMVTQVSEEKQVVLSSLQNQSVSWYEKG